MLPVIQDVFEKQGATYENIVIPFTDGIKTLQVVTNLKEAVESRGENIPESIEKSVTLVPQQGAPVYLELDYSSSTEFLVGMYINYSQDVVRRDLIWVTPKQEWNKIYINLTQTVSESLGAESFKIFLNMRRTDPSLSEEINFDNIKILY